MTQNHEMDEKHNKNNTAVPHTKEAVTSGIDEECDSIRIHIVKTQNMRV